MAEFESLKAEIGSVLVILGGSHPPSMCSDGLWLDPPDSDLN